MNPTVSGYNMKAQVKALLSPLESCSAHSITCKRTWQHLQCSVQSLGIAPSQASLRQWALLHVPRGRSFCTHGRYHQISVTLLARHLSVLPDIIATGSLGSTEPCTDGEQLVESVCTTLCILNSGWALSHFWSQSCTAAYGAPTGRN